MAWLKGLAGKAEDFLNQIDQNAAVALHGDKKTPSKDALLTEVTWDNQHQSRENSNPAIISWTGSTSIPSVRSSPNLNSVTPSRLPTPRNDEDLIQFLNSSETILSVAVVNEQDQSTTESSVINSSSETESNNFLPVKFETLHEKTSQNITSDGSSSSSRSSPQEILPEAQLNYQTPRSPSRVTENGVTGIITSMSDLHTENELLRKELRTLNNEMSLLRNRAKTAEKECSSQQKLIAQLQERADQANQLEQELLFAHQQALASQETLNSLRIENDKLIKSCADSEGSQNESLQLLETELISIQKKHTEEIINLERRLSSIQEERDGLNMQLVEMRQQISQKENTLTSLNQQIERMRLETREARDELEQYRLRAQRILQDKEKLINELRGEGGTPEGQDDTVVLELQQLRQERELLREETAQVTTRLQAVRDELSDVEKRFETYREQTTDAHCRLQENVAEERKRRQAAEEDCKTHGEELRSVRDELSRQRSLLANRVREREAELTRLRTQLSQRPTSPTDDELESRLHALTQTLVQKQNSLETVTTEKNALRLQLEKMERKHQEMSMLHQNQSGIVNVNDTDDAKAQIPSFFVETPFDTGMTRRVKRAYSSLDAVSIRTGVFLRRYPLARILVLCYMVLLHLWVMLVLFTYTPQAQ